MMPSILRGLLLTALILAVSGSAHAASSCVSGGCHAKQVSFKFLHGPLAVEQQSGKGCISCHKSGGKPCTATAKGAFTFVEDKDKLCTMCHEKTESPNHVARTSNCAKCHNPHGSNKDMRHLR